MILYLRGGGGSVRKDLNRILKLFLRKLFQIFWNVDILSYDLILVLMQKSLPSWVQSKKFCDDGTFRLLLIKSLYST